MKPIPVPPIASFVERMNRRLVNASQIGLNSLNCIVALVCHRDDYTEL